MKFFLFTLILFISGFGFVSPWEPEVEENEQNPSASEIAGRIAKNYGIRWFYQVEAIRFTFKATIPSGEGKKNDKTIQRIWYWEPISGFVRLENGPEGKPVEFFHKENQKLENQVRQADQWFVNDRYWLMFPYHMEWDQELEITDGGIDLLPVPPGTGNCIKVSYSDNVGYTPGDEYRVFYDSLYFIDQWSYHPGGREEAARKTNWENHVKAGPMVVSLVRKNPATGFMIEFENFSVRLKDSKKWEIPEKVEK